jgi:PAS domain S-box-containing protein
MASEARADSLEAFERSLDALLAAADLDAVLAAGARGLAEVAGARVVAAFVFDEGHALAESWHPVSFRRLPEAAALRARAAEAMGAAAATVSAPLPPGVRVLPLATRGHEFGVALLVPGPAELVSDARVERLGRALACRTGAQLETTRSQGLHARYERWFKTLDEQLRVLDRERQKFSAIVHSSDAEVFVTDLSGTIRWTNSVMAASPPGNAGSWIGLSCREACRRLTQDGDGHACGSCPVTRARDENAVAHREYRDLRREDPRSVYLTALPIRGPHGKADEVMVMLQDLSDLETLRASEARYRLLFERSSRAIVMVDPVTRQIVLANPTASRMTGRSLAELRGLRLDELHPEAEWPALEPFYVRVLAGEALEPRECAVRRKDGSHRLTRVTGTITDLDGRQVLMLEMRDVTEAKRVEEALRLAEERLRTVVAGCPIVLFAVDREGVFTVSEGAGLARLGLAPGQVVGTSVYELYRDHPRILECVRGALSGQSITNVVEVAGVAFETRYSPLRDAEGGIVGAIGVATDVTERRRLEEQLRQAQRMEAIGRLAGGVAHDFNNLLAAILGHGELMIGRLEEGHPMRRGVEEIQKAAMRGAVLTRQLLAFGRKEVLALRTVDVNQVVAGMEEMLRRLIGEDVQLECVPAPRPAAVRADRGQLEQVVVNLVANARDAMPRGGRLTIEVGHVELDEERAQRHPGARSGPHVRLLVADSGCGMDADTLAHVFEPFFTTKERGKGTGLGLATVYGIVEQSGGHVIVASQPGVGSTFCVYFPASAEDVAEPETEPLPAAAQGGTETVLLAEDEEAVRTTAREALESAGYRVMEARDGLEALEIASAFPGDIHLLVSDVVMPRMGGGELASRLETARPETRVLFVSGYPDDAVVHHGVAERGATLLQKPFALADLVRRVREVLDAPRRRAA